MRSITMEVPLCLPCVWLLLFVNQPGKKPVSGARGRRPCDIGSPLARALVSEPCWPAKAKLRDTLAGHQGASWPTGILRLQS